MRHHHLPVIRPVPPPPPPPILKPAKPVAAPPIKLPPPPINRQTAEFNAAGLTAKTALFKKADPPLTLPTAAPPTPTPPAPTPARIIAPTQFIGPVPPVVLSSRVPAAPGQLSLVESKDASGAAYDAKNVGEVYRFGDGSAWRVDKVQDNQGFFDTGFKAVAMRRVVPEGNGFKDDPTDNRVAVGFAGTDGLNDINDDIDQGTGSLLPPAQYRQGVAFTEEVRNEAARSCETVTATGHSLGGGIASYVSTQTGIPATAINSAPLAVSNYPGRKGDYESQITQYHVKDEFLTGINDINPLDARPGRDVVVNERYQPEEPTRNNRPLVETKNAWLTITNHKLGNTAPEIAEAVKIYP